VDLVDQMLDELGGDYERYKSERNPQQGIIRIVIRKIFEQFSGQVYEIDIVYSVGEQQRYDLQRDKGEEGVIQRFFAGFFLVCE
jgi:hypothetical protein